MISVANSLNALSPLDGRYANSTKDLSTYFSESALMQYRLKVEIEYIIALGNEKSIKELPPFSKNDQTRLRKIYHNFNTACAEKVKEIESTTNHDVKAVEYYIKEKFNDLNLMPKLKFGLFLGDIVSPHPVAQDWNEVDLDNLFK